MEVKPVRRPSDGVSEGTPRSTARSRVVGRGTNIVAHDDSSLREVIPDGTDFAPDVLGGVVAVMKEEATLTNEAGVRFQPNHGVRLYGRDPLVGLETLGKQRVNVHRVDTANTVTRDGESQVPRRAAPVRSGFNNDGRAKRPRNPVQEDPLDFPNAPTRKTPEFAALTVIFPEVPVQIPRKAKPRCGLAHRPLELLPDIRPPTQHTETAKAPGVLRPPEKI